MKLFQLYDVPIHNILTAIIVPTITITAILWN